MGRKSIRENKTAYQQAREKQGYTLEEAGELIDGLSSERITRIENGSVRVQPEDVILMAEGYKAPELRNYYCSHECAIGRASVREIEKKSFGQIAIETVNALNRLSTQKDRLLEIVEDGQIRPDEHSDFLEIKETLDKIADSVSAMQLWVDVQIAEGKLDPEIFEK